VADPPILEKGSWGRINTRKIEIFRMAMNNRQPDLSPGMSHEGTTMGPFPGIKARIAKANLGNRKVATTKYQWET
jgi:hypothetical protein